LNEEIKNENFTSEEVMTHRPRKKKRAALIIVIVVVLVLVLLAYQILANFGGSGNVVEPIPVNVRVTTTEIMSIYSTAPISGRIEPIDEVAIMPLASGEVTRVHVRMGDRVNAGATLFEIDRSQAAASLNQARAGLSQAQSGLNQANENLLNSRTALERTQTLFNEGAVSLQALEQAQTQYNTARESVNSSRASVGVANAQVSAASNVHGNATVTSPISGYVTALNVSVGSMASPGSAAAVVADISSLEINASVSEHLAHRISAGTPVDIHISSLGDIIHTGEITAISPAPALGALTYPIRISVNNEHGNIMAGMFAEVRLVAEERDMVVGVPSDAVIIRGGRSVVIVIDNENIPSLREVEIGIDNGEFAEIVSGLSAGEVIVTTGQHFINEGEAVNIVE